MYEKVNPRHPDKIADRIAGALVDMAYRKQDDPKIAVEVLIGHGECHIIAETSVRLDSEEISRTVNRITGEEIETFLRQVPQDERLARNQEDKIKCGDNGIFRGMPITDEQQTLADIARDIYSIYKEDGKYILDGDNLTICQSNAATAELRKYFPIAKINPIGDWTGGPDTDTGAVNRKLGSDMADAVTGGGLHGKDLSKADVSVNIWCHLEAQKRGEPVELSCSIGDEYIAGIPYSEIVETARKYIKDRGGFEKFAEWGLIDGDNH